MRILLLEDDHYQGESLCSALSTFGPTVWLTTEREFVEAWPQLLREPPDLAVIDLMIRWDTVRADAMPPPEGTVIFDAGVRCARRFLEIAPTLSPVVIIYSVVDPPELPPNARFVSKGAGTRELMEVVGDLARDFPSFA
jgi:CheY-like chemotaxis protein